MSEEKFECVFGFGDCPVRALMAKEKNEAEIFTKSIPMQPPKDNTRDASMFVNSMLASFTTMMQMASGLRDLAQFCAACPKAKKGVG